VPAKSPKAEIIRRVSKIVELLLDGFSRADILQNAAKKWGVVERTIDTYIASANARIKKQAEETENEIFNVVRLRLENLYKKAIAANDRHLARLLLRDMTKLYGLDKSDRFKFGPNLPEDITIDIVD